ncbi:unnamed protein product [Gadus morhua 'NCC']
MGARPSEALFLGSPWGNKVNTSGVSVQERRSLKNEKEDEDLWTTSKGRRELLGRCLLSQLSSHHGIDPHHTTGASSGWK